MGTVKFTLMSNPSQGSVRKRKQAGAELGQAKLKLGLDFTKN